MTGATSAPSGVPRRNHFGGTDPLGRRSGYRRRVGEGAGHPSHHRANARSWERQRKVAEFKSRKPRWANADAKIIHFYSSRRCIFPFEIFFLSFRMRKKKQKKAFRDLGSFVLRAHCVNTLPHRRLIYVDVEYTSIKLSPKTIFVFRWIIHSFFLHEFFPSEALAFQIK